ncbi:MAG: SMI1/KNR4 family protein [Marinicella sp.]
MAKHNKSVMYKLNYKLVLRIIRDYFLIIKLPKDYTDYLAQTEVFFGETDFEFGGYFELEPLENIEEFNKDIQTGIYAPGFIAFGSDGGGEILAFDKSGKIYLLPLIGMSLNDAILIASSWHEFEQHILNP